MADARVFLECEACGQSALIWKCLGSDGHAVMAQDNLGAFMNAHLLGADWDTDCDGAPLSINDAPGLRVRGENGGDWDGTNKRWRRR